MKHTLQSTLRRHVTFDPAKAEHRAAYWKLRTEGQQDLELRFMLEAPYTNVLAMMQARIADHFSEPTKVEVPAQKRRVG